MRFLHCNKTELWGRREKARAGNGRTGASAIPVRKENPPCKGKACGGPNITVGKLADELPRKAAIVYVTPVP